MSHETIETVAGQFHSYEKLHPFLWAGDSTVTLVSKLTGKRFTYNIKRTKFKSDVFFVSVLVQPETYAYIGMVDITNQECYTTKNSKVTVDAPSYKAFHWFIGQLFLNPELLFDKMEIWHEGRCGKCGRQLTVPESIANGIGPDCLAKMEGGE